MVTGCCQILFHLANVAGQASECRGSLKWSACRRENNSIMCCRSARRLLTGVAVSRKTCLIRSGPTRSGHTVPQTRMPLGPFALDARVAEVVRLVDDDGVGPILDFLEFVRLGGRCRSVWLKMARLLPKMRRVR